KPCGCGAALAGCPPGLPAAFGSPGFPAPPGAPGPPNPPRPPRLRPPPRKSGISPAVIELAVIPVGTPCTCSSSPTRRSDTLTVAWETNLVLLVILIVWLLPPNAGVMVIYPAFRSPPVIVP